MQIDKVNAYAKKQKEAEIVHSALTHIVKEELKSPWKQWIVATTHGFKDKFKEERQLA